MHMFLEALGAMTLLSIIALGSWLFLFFIGCRVLWIELVVGVVDFLIALHRRAEKKKKLKEEEERRGGRETILPPPEKKD